MKRYIAIIIVYFISNIAFSICMEESDTNQNIGINSNKPVVITQSRYQKNNEYKKRLTELLEKVDQWLFVYSPEKNKYILNLLPLENLIYDVQDGREIRSIQDYGVQEKEREIEFQDKQGLLSYIMPTEYRPIISPDEEIEIRELLKETDILCCKHTKEDLYNKEGLTADLAKIIANYDTKKLDILLQYPNLSSEVFCCLQEFLKNKRKSNIVIALDKCKNIDEITSFNTISYYINDGSELNKKTLDMLRSKKVFYSYWLKKAIDFFMKDGFEVKNGFYKAIIHDAFQHFPLNTAKNIIDLAQKTKLPIEKRRALSIIKTYNDDLLQKVLDFCPDILKTAAHDEKFVKVLLDSGVKFNPEQLKLILKENNLASIYFILRKKPFSLKEGSISSWFYTNGSYPESFDFNSVTKCEGLVNYTKQMIINSLQENQYRYAKGALGFLLEASNTGEVKLLETCISQNKPSQEIFALKEGNEISKEIVQEDREVLNQICQSGNISYSEESIKKVGNFVEKYSEILHKNPNFLNGLLTKIKVFNEEENERMRIKVNSQPTFCWPSIGIGPSAYLLYRSSCEGNFNPWIACLATGALAWSGWKTYAYYKNYQQLAPAIDLQRKTNELEGFLTSLENQKKLIKIQDEQKSKVDISNVRQWPKIAPKILGPLALGFFALPVIPAIFKTVFKADTQVEAANDNKPTFGFLSKIVSGLSFSALSTWLWQQNKNKFGSDDAQILFMSSQERGKSAGFLKIQEFNQFKNNDALLKLTQSSEN